MVDKMEGPNGKVKNLKRAIFRAGSSLWKMLPIILGTILLVSLVNVLVPRNFYLSLFRGNLFLDSLIGGLVGSILVGNPVMSYILGGEFLERGVSLVAVTSFILAWVTVGVVQLPAEATILGKKFAIIRNVISFILAIGGAILTVLVLNLVGGM